MNGWGVIRTFTLPRVQVLGLHEGLLPPIKVKDFPFREVLQKKTLTLTFKVHPI